jgi:hypothetical protein
MKRHFIQCIVLCFSILVVAGCNTAPPMLQTGPGAEVTYDGLTKVDNTRFDDVWLRPDIDLRNYNKVIFETTEIAYRPTRSPAAFPLSDAQKTRLAAELTDVFVSRLKSSNVFELVTDPGPEVLLLRAGLQDVVSNVPPQALNRSDLYLNEVGRATLVLELYDSDSNTILARALDRQAAGRMEMIEADSVQTWQEVRQVGDRWAVITRDGLEALIQGTAF